MPDAADIQHQTSNIPHEFVLDQNFPNPFNPLTVIHYQLPVQSHVTLSIFNMLGQEVTKLVDADQEAGYESVQWDAGGMSSGVYFYKLQAGAYEETKQLLLLR